jgi:hypothetical protein
VTADELSAFLAVVEAHPRIVRFELGDLKLTMAADSPREASAAAEPEGEPEELELPDGVFDPRRAIEHVYAKARQRAPKVEAG